VNYGNFLLEGEKRAKLRNINDCFDHFTGLNSQH